MTAILYVNGVKDPRLYSKRLAEEKLVVQLMDFFSELSPRQN